MAVFRHDVLIIGSGAAGLTTALHLPKTVTVGVLSKGTLTSANTFHAQGGVAAVLDGTDTLEAHIHDTHVAGAGLCHDDAVRKTVTDGPEAIGWLIDQGVAFTHTQGDQEGQLAYHLTREGGHSHRRIIHAADATGQAISTALIAKVRTYSNVTLYEDRIAVDLITHGTGAARRVIGAYIHHIKSGQVDTFLARAVVLPFDCKQSQHQACCSVVA
ncbi:MAG: FAD-binding protein, partial [Rhodanobacter sp.]